MTQSEKAFLEAYRISDYEVPLTTVDMVIFSVHEEEVHVLLVERAEHPEKGKWALPGGFIHLAEDVSIEATAYRKLEEKTGLRSPYLEQVATVGNSKRDKRGWALTVLYFALIHHLDLEEGHGDAVEQVRWEPLSRALKRRLAFDHHKLLAMAANRLRSKARYSALPLSLMPEEFTLAELQHMFEIVLGTSLEKKSFRRRFLAAELLEATGAMKPTGRRPAALYRMIGPLQEGFVFPGLLEATPEVLR